MDRDYILYDNWKEYLGPLGAEIIRLQAGWVKTEQEKGAQYTTAQYSQCQVELR